MKKPASQDNEARQPIDLLALHEKAQRYCNLCPRLCHHSCPVSNADRDEAVTPGNKNSMAGFVRRGMRPLDEGAADLFYKCLGCGLCTTYCQHENDVAGSLLSARALAAGAGLAPPALVEERESFERFGNAWLEDLGPRLRDMVAPGRRVGVGGPVSAGRASRVPGRGLRIYWPGCAMLARKPDLVALTLEVCDRLGEPDVSVYCGEEAQCCGYPLLAAGRHEAFVEHARKASRALEGADVIFTGAPECAWTFGVAWPTRAGVSAPAPRIAHVVDLLLPALRQAPALPPIELDAVYHDPCYLGRSLGRYDEPRSLLNAVLRRPVGEAASWSRSESYCCGAGGALETTSPETARAITRARVGELLGATSGPPGEAGPEELPEGRHIVSACPRCETRFREAGASALDIVEVLARYLRIGERNDEEAMS